MSGAMQAFFRASQRTARVCQRWLTKDEKRPDAEGQARVLRFRRQRFPAVLAPFWRQLAVVRRLFTVVLRLFAVSLWLFAVVLRLLTIVLAVFHRRFTLMLRAFFRRRRRVVGSKSP